MSCSEFRRTERASGAGQTVRWRLPRLLATVMIVALAAPFAWASQAEKEGGEISSASPSDSADVVEQAPDSVADQTAGETEFTRRDMLVYSLWIFVLAILLGFEVITKVPPTLHTPLMSGSNAISGITIVGALIVAGHGLGLASFLGFVAVALASVNVVGGFLVTHRMLAMFKKR